MGSTSVAASFAARRFSSTRRVFDRLTGNGWHCAVPEQYSREQNDGRTVVVQIATNRHLRNPSSAAASLRCNLSLRFNSCTAARYALRDVFP